jgi:hypothetical protein
MNWRYATGRCIKNATLAISRITSSPKAKNQHAMYNMIDMDIDLHFDTSSASIVFRVTEQSLCFRRIVPIYFTFCNFAVS